MRDLKFLNRLQIPVRLFCRQLLHQDRCRRSMLKPRLQRQWSLTRCILNNKRKSQSQDYRMEHSRYTPSGASSECLKTSLRSSRFACCNHPKTSAPFSQYSLSLDMVIISFLDYFQCFFLDSIFLSAYFPHVCWMTG